MAGLGRRKGQKPGERLYYRGETDAQCSSCKEIKPLSAYTAGNERTCKSCKRQHHLVRKYGLTLKAFASMLALQNGLCAICKRRKAKYVDHSHSTGVVRGLLCQPCNTALGAFYDSEEIMNTAVAYVRRAAIAINE